MPVIVINTNVGAGAVIDASDDASAVGGALFVANVRPG